MEASIELLLDYNNIQSTPEVVQYMAKTIKLFIINWLLAHSIQFA